MAIKTKITKSRVQKQIATVKQTIAHEIKLRESLLNELRNVEAQIVRCRQKTEEKEIAKLRKIVASF